MSKEQELQQIAQQAIQSAKGATNREEKARFSKVAEKAVEQIKQLQIQQGKDIAATAVPLAGKVSIPLSEQSSQSVRDARSAQYDLPPMPKSSAKDYGSMPSQDYPSFTEAATYAGQAIQRNANVAGGVTGAIAGAPLGLPGMIVGGALGTFGGEVYYEGVPIDWENAVKSSAFSVGLDLATLGASKVIGPVIKNMWKSRMSPEDVVEQLANSQKAPKVDTPAALAQAQRTVERGGTTLSPAEINSSSGFLNFMDSLSREAIGAKGVVERRRSALENVVKGEYDRLFGANSLGKDMDSNSIANQVVNIVSKGKAGLAHNYNKGIDEVTELLSSEVVRTGPIKRKLQKILDGKRITDDVSALSDKSSALITKMVNTLPYEIKAIDLLKLEKKYMNEITDIGTFGSQNFSDVSSAELARVSSDYRKSILGVISQANPRAGMMYSRVKTSYSKGLDGILPEINKGFIIKGEKNNFEALGRLMTNVSNTDQLSTLLGQVRASYRTMTAADSSGLVFDTAAEAVSAIRTSYVNQIFRGADTEGGGLMALGRLAKRYEDPAKVKQLRAVLGPKADTVKRFMNLLYAVSKDPASPTGTLVLRSKEASSAGALGSMLLTGGAGTAAVASGVGVPTAIILAGAVFTAPAIIQKYVARPAVVNRLIAATRNTKYDTAEKLSVAINNIAYEYDLFVDDVTSDKPISGLMPNSQRVSE